MEFQEFQACVLGWNKTHGAEEVPPVMSDDAFDKAVEQIENG